MTERIGQNDMNRRPSNWTSTYGQLHAWMRFTAFPVGILAPHKVRIYSRGAHFILNWWDPGEKRSLSERIDGDLLAALARARAIDERLAATGATGTGHRARISHADLVARFLADLARRADAGEIVPATVGRYRTALGHYLAFAESPEIARTVPSATRVDRQFRLGLNAFLATRIVNGNGRGTAGRPMRSANFVILATRAMYEWAADPDRGRLLPDGFRSPFRTAAGRMPVFKGDPLAKPDISVDMAADLVRACDDYQARLFVPLILFGLRAAEPRFAFSVDLAEGWLAVPCRPGLLLATKGKRDKRFPLLPELDAFWQSFDTSAGLLFRRRDAATPPEWARTEAGIVGEFRRRAEGIGTAAGRVRIRDAVLRDAGALSYDRIDGEFRGLASRLGWPKTATLKDFRHAFATSLHDAGMPEGYRRYLLGHAPGTAASVAYTHLADLREKYLASVRTAFPAVVAAVLARRFGGPGG